MTELNLHEVTGSGRVHNLAGKDRGSSARALFKLDILDNNPESVTVIVPDYLDTISTSYFLGLFSKSVKNLGADNFKNKYRFVADEVMQKQINHGIKLSESLSNKSE